ncbi:MAG: 3-keto-disaccharide hydrolase [Sphingobacteriaceae bacterium]
MIKKELKNAGGILLMALALASCGNSQTKVTNNADTTTSTENKPGEWIALFDGKTLDGWHGFNKTGSIPNWTIEDSALVCLGAAKDASGGDIVTNKKFENFELTWDWKVDKGSNSGVMYHVIEDAKYHAPYETGPEYQIIDDIGFPEKLENWQKAGADYAMNLPNDKKKLKPVGEWNTSKIIYDKGHVEHWLNGEKIVEFQAGTDEWNKEKAEGKWKDYPDYGTAKSGPIALQDHGNKAYFKNIMIREL